MRLDSSVRLLVKAITTLKHQGVDSTMQTQLKGQYGTVIDNNDGDVCVSFEFEDGDYHAVQVWVPESLVREQHDIR